MNPNNGRYTYLQEVILLAPNLKTLFSVASSARQLLQTHESSTCVVLLAVVSTNAFRGRPRQSQFKSSEHNWRFLILALCPILCYPQSLLLTPGLLAGRR